MWVRPPLCALVFCALLSAQEGAKQLQDVRRIYVDSSEGGDAAEAIRSKIVAELGKARRFEVVESADRADAVLTVASRISKAARNGVNANGQPPNARGNDRYHITAAVRLTGKDQTVLWDEDASSGAASHFTATSNLADRIVKDLLKAIPKPK
jgi:hypothetical protein